MIKVNKLCSVTYTEPTRGMACLPIRRTFCWLEVWDYWYHIQRDTSLWCLMLFHGNNLDNLFCWRFQFLANSMFSFSTNLLMFCCFVIFICIDMFLAVVLEKSRLCDTLYGMVKRLLVTDKLGDALIIMGKWYKNLKKKIHVQQKHFGHYYMCMNIIRRL